MSERQDRCPDCEWVETKDLNTGERSVRRGEACQRHGGPLGVHVDRAPDPRPQQIIDDPAGWFARARVKAWAEAEAIPRNGRRRRTIAYKGRVEFNDCACAGISRRKVGKRNEWTLVTRPCAAHLRDARAEVEDERRGR